MCTSEPLPLSVTEQEFPEQDTRLTEPDLDPDPPAAEALTAPAETPTPPAAAAQRPGDDRVHAASSTSSRVCTRACTETVRFLETEHGRRNELLTGHLRTDEEWSSHRARRRCRQVGDDV
jgi:hypothetical protein